jgi:TFIIF-interacting CTD phosphatase-like protein
MSPARPPPTFNTYSKKAAKKRHRTHISSDESDLSSPRKRSKMQVEVVISSPPKVASAQRKRPPQGTAHSCNHTELTSLSIVDDNSDTAPSSSKHLIDLPSAQSASKRARGTSTPPWSQSIRQCSSKVYRCLPGSTSLRRKIRDPHSPFLPVWT